MTGSIGVIVKFPNLEGLFEKIGYKSQVIKSGPLKDVGASNRPLSDNERRLLQDLIDNVYGQFVRDIAAAREMDENTVRGLADGRIYTGEQALAVGLIDRLGNFTDAIGAAADMGGLDDENPRLIYPRTERKFSLLNLLTSAEQSLVDNFVPLYPILSFEWPGVQ
jgi:protease-4